MASPPGLKEKVGGERGLAKRLSNHQAYRIMR
jgi:hypothetical protein